MALKILIVLTEDHQNVEVLPVFIHSISKTINTFDFIFWHNSSWNIFVVVFPQNKILIFQLLSIFPSVHRRPIVHPHLFPSPSPRIRLVNSRPRSFPPPAVVVPRPTAKKKIRDPIHPALLRGYYERLLGPGLGVENPRQFVLTNIKATSCLETRLALTRSRFRNHFLTSAGWKTAEGIMTGWNLGEAFLSGSFGVLERLVEQQVEGF